jgi:hypothetical protein
LGEIRRQPSGVILQNVSAAELEAALAAGAGKIRRRSRGLARRPRARAPILA